MADFHKYKEITQKELVVNERSGNQRWMGILNDVKNEMTKVNKFLKILQGLQKIQRQWQHFVREQLNLITTIGVKQVIFRITLHFC